VNSPPPTSATFSFQTLNNYYSLWRCPGTEPLPRHGSKRTTRKSRVESTPKTTVDRPVCAGQAKPCVEILSVSRDTKFPKTSLAYTSKSDRAKPVAEAGSPRERDKQKPIHPSSTAQQPRWVQTSNRRLVRKTKSICKREREGLRNSHYIKLLRIYF
jgi:hypothetical protein